MIYCILLGCFLLFFIGFLMLSSCKKCKLDNLFNKLLKKIKNLLNDLNNFINEDELSLNKYFSSKSKKEKDFFHYIGPKHGRNTY